jgi:hypothetical protein
MVKSKVKCSLVQELRLYTGRTVHRGSRGIALPFLDHGTRRGWGVSLTPRPLFTPGKTRYPFYAVWNSEPVRTGAENLASTGIRSPDRPARSQSLYRLRYPAHYKYYSEHKIKKDNLGEVCSMHDLWTLHPKLGYQNLKAIGHIEE